MAETVDAAGLRDRTDDEQFAIVVTRDEESFSGWRISGTVEYRSEPGTEVNPEDFRRRTGLEPPDPIVTVCSEGVSREISPGNWKRRATRT